MEVADLVLLVGYSGGVFLYVFCVGCVFDGVVSRRGFVMRPCGCGLVGVFRFVQIGCSI